MKITIEQAEEGLKIAIENIGNVNEVIGLLERAKLSLWEKWPKDINLNDATK